MKNLIIILILFLMYSGCNNNRVIIVKTDNKNYSKKIEQIIDNSYKNQETIRKIDSLEKLIKVDPKSNLYIERGYYFINNKEYERGSEDFKLVLKSDSDNLYALLGMALYYSKISESEDSQNFVGKAFTIDTLNALAYNLRAGNRNKKILFPLMEDMLHDLSKAITISATFKDSYIKRAIIYNYMDSLDKALGDIDYIIKSAPDNPIYYIHRMIHYEKAKNYKGLIDDYSKYMELVPESKIGYLYARASVYKVLNEYDRAIDDLIEVGRIDPEVGTMHYFEISGLYAQLGKTDSCLIYVKKAIEKGGYTKADFEKDSLFAKVIKEKEFQNYHEIKHTLE